MRKTILFIIFCIYSSFFPFILYAQSTQIKSLGTLIDILNNPQNYPNYIMVNAHRGYWKDYPENSISAIQAAIKIGADMVELDVRPTKDGVLVVAHDRWLGRLSTNTIGSAKSIEEMNYSEFKNEFLLDPYGKVTKEHIPTLSEALDVCKGKILVNLDKIDGLFNEVYQLVEGKGMLNQTVFKFKSFRLGDPQELRRKFGSDMINGMNVTPIIFHDNKYCFPKAGQPEGTNCVARSTSEEEDGCKPGQEDRCRSVTINEFIQSFIDDPNINCPGFEAIYLNDTDLLYTIAPSIKSDNKQLIQFPEWPECCDGNWDPNLRIFKTPTRQYVDTNKRSNWQWLVNLDAQHRPTMIISDRLEVLIQLLEMKGLRNLESN